MRRRIFSQVILVLTTVVLTTILQPLAYLPTFGQSGCHTFPLTGKRVCGRFLQYWQQNGGVMQQGYPISNEFVEVSDLNGRPYVVQYFERAVFEYHPENRPPYDVLLSHLGTFQFRRKYPRGEPRPSPPAPTSPPALTSTPAPATAVPPTSQPTSPPEPSEPTTEPPPRTPPPPTQTSVPPPPPVSPTATRLPNTPAPQPTGTPAPPPPPPPPITNTPAPPPPPPP